MPLASGTRLGPYEIVSPLGAGGMGEVWRARDTTLNRDVAIKILPEAFVSDPERVARFQREAQLLAALNHPNIAAIYGLEEGPAFAPDGASARKQAGKAEQERSDSPTAFIVMELVEGESIAQRLSSVASGYRRTSQAPAERLQRDGGPGPKPEARSPKPDGAQHQGLPVDEALLIARQIVDALEAAHDKGIIHRDLKPANIMMTADGVVKVLDFGLAKTVQAPGSGLQAPGGVSQSPTITTPAHLRPGSGGQAMTQAGMILGTAAYMSPEQAKGRPADKRSDVWAFGCVLYEMLTGRRAFEGEDISDTLAAILRGEPDWSALPADVTPLIRTLLKRCLERDRKTRIPDIAVVRFLMDDAGAASAALATQAAPAAARGSAWLGWAAAAVLFLTTIALGAWMYVGSTPADGRMMRFFVSPPDGWRLGVGFNAGSGAPAPLTVSPDGRRVAFLANGGTGRSRLRVRALDTLAAQELPGTDGATMPFWSPDSQSLAFQTDGKLKKISVSGGPPVTLCDAANFRGGAWGRDGVIVFAPGNTSALQKVSAAGGVPTAATVLAEGEQGHARPAFLPDGRHFLYGVFGGGFYAGSLDSSDRTQLFKTFDNMNVLYSQGYLLFMRETTLMAQPFDARRLTLSGEPVPIAEQVQSIGVPSGANAAIGVFSVSDNGVLAYQTGTEAGAAQLTWLDRTGKPVSNVGEPGSFSDLALAPDGKRATVSLAAGARQGRDIWIVDIARGLRTRFTFDPTDELSTAWSPDGSRIVFNSRRKGHLVVDIADVKPGGA